MDWSKVDARGVCWEWTGHVTEDGYGPHRQVYEELIGATIGELTYDHLCRNKRCVNPDHADLVTHRVNILRGNGMGGRNARKTHCPKGHPFDEEIPHRQLGRVTMARSCSRCRKERQRINQRNYQLRKKSR